MAKEKINGKLGLDIHHIATWDLPREYCSTVSDYVIKGNARIDKLDIVDFVSVRHELMEKIPNEINGLDIGRMQTFLRQKGIEPCDLLVFRHENLKAFYDIVKKVEPVAVERFYRAALNSLEQKGGCILGSHSRQLNMSFVFRNEKLENELGIIYRNYLESIAIHELAHSAWEWGNGSGSFFSEGFADLLAGEYRKNYVVDGKKGIAILDMFGVSYDQEMTSIDSIGDMMIEAPSYSVPFKYLYINGNGELEGSEISIYGYILELLSKKIGDKDFFIKNRGNPGEMYLALENIKPGLFNFLAKEGLKELSLKEIVNTLNLVKSL